MRGGSILFVHGTGVRIRSYQKTYAAVKKRAAQEKIDLPIVECQWGDALGIEPPSWSVPEPPDAAEESRRAVAEEAWSYLDDDPLFELRVLSVSGASRPGRFGEEQAHEVFWDSVVAYTPTLELEALLERMNAADHWLAAWTAVVETSPVAKSAVQASGADTADVAMALARALYAELGIRVRRDGLPALGSTYRDRFVDRLRVDWGFEVFALPAVVKRFFASLLRERRRGLGDRVWPELGDVILYQAHGAEIRAFIRTKIERASPPVYLVAHSLGGIACFDLLALAHPPPVAGLMTVGSQAPLLYELGALTSLRRGDPLPPGFPERWYNLYDRGDFLSYVAGRLFPGRVEDVEVSSGELPLAAHSAYWNRDETWAAIRTFTGSVD